MKQISFSEVEFEGKKRTTRREVFLSEMEKVTPWAEVFEVIAPHYPKGKRGRPPVGLERMLRVKWTPKSRQESSLFKLGI